MRMFLAALALTGAIGLSSCASTGYGYGGGTQLSQCTRNALLAAGAGAILGAVTAPDGNRGENAAMGAAGAGLATYGVCRWLQARDQANIERGYQQALLDGRSVNSSWQTDDGANRTVYVNSPTPSDRGPECRRITATVEDPQYGRQPLPPETYCRNASGQWVPV